MEKDTQNSYIIRPAFNKKFRPHIVKELIRNVLFERLSGLTYHPENTTQWTREIADDIKLKLKEFELDRYKFVVQVVIGEQRGEGVKMGSRCMWDADTDNYAQEVFLNESLFAIAVAFGVYTY
eukprot:GCRY01001646.1.p1 GENE.GCRY01001646.1~~GCRY01001646.1.p1  ORF type:complete len:123 (-),score=12.06 GCRY01001646.1:81-449(-)